MPFLQILTGDRAEELFELPTDATLVVGSGPEAHIRLPDSRVAATHCQVFPARGGVWLRDLGQGPTVSNLRRVAGETTRLCSLDMLIIGHTFVRYLEERPGPPPGAAPRGADPAELASANERVRELEGLLRSLKGHAAAAHTERDTARQVASDLRAQLTSAEDSSQRSGVELERARERVQTLEKEQDKARARLNELKEEARKALAAKAEEIQLSQEALAELEATVAQEQRERLRLEEALAKAGAQITALQGELAQVTQGAEERVTRAVSEQRQRLSALETSLSASLACLDASRAALQGLGVEPPAAPDRPEGVVPLELAAILDGASLSAEVRARLERALAAHVDQESLRRFSGPPFSWERPPRALEVLAELGALRARGERRLTGLQLGTTTA